MLPEVAKTVMHFRRKHEFCVAEMTEDRPGVMDGQVALLKPCIGIVTVVEDDHMAAFASREDIASEIGKLVPDPIIKLPTYSLFSLL